MARGKTGQAKGKVKKNKTKSEDRTSLNVGKFDPHQSRIKRLTDWDQEDIQDEQDEFFEGLDKVSLDQVARDHQSVNDLEIPEQLLDIDDGQSEEAAEEFSQDEPSNSELKSKRQRKLKTPIDNSRKGRFGKLPSTEDDSNNSEGSLEDIDQNQPDAQEKSEGNLEENDPSDDDELTWKSYHVIKHKSKKKPTTNDQEALKEEEERRALELEEVKRLQAKARSKLIPSDFSSYLDYASDEELATQNNVNEKKLDNDLLDQSSLPVKEFHSESEAISYLLKTRPESLALLDDLRRSLDVLSELEDKLASGSSDHSDVTELGKNQAIDFLHYQILSTYISHAAFYMHLLLQVPSTDPSLLTSVMKSLIDLRSTLNMMEQNDLIGDGLDSGLELDYDMFNGQFSPTEFDEELRDLLSDQVNVQGAISAESLPLSSTGKRPRSVQTKADLSEEDMETTASKSKLKRNKKIKTQQKRPVSQFLEVEDPNLSLENLPPRPSKSKIHESLSASREANMDDIDFVEPSSLTEKERSEKAKKKKDLRFYTSKIQAKGKRREKALAGSGAIGGDSDLPYITKEAQRREFLKQQDHHHVSNLDYDDDVSGEDSGHRSNLVVPSNVNDSDYYETIKELKLSAKKSKKAQYDQQKLAERDLLTRSGEIEEDGGPRSISRQILKNKGLTPKRAKENRNPRVKKRKRFEKAQQKISSQRPTFKPDQAAQNRTIAGYQGERTGVKVGLVKSRKL